MGRSKVQFQRIEDKGARKTTFNKRNAGIMKKAMELSVLCNCEIALAIFDEHGNLHQFASDDMHPTLKRVMAHTGKKDTKNSEALLRRCGARKDQAARENMSLGHQIHLTPSSQTGLELSADSFGSMVHGVEDKAMTPPASPAPSSPVHDFFDDLDAMDINCDLDKESCFGRPLPYEGPAKLAPRLQRSVDSLMRDIQLVHQAGELLKDPFAIRATGVAC
jgi:hypothetical protein